MIYRPASQNCAYADQQHTMDREEVPGEAIATDLANIPDNGCGNTAPSVEGNGQLPLQASSLHSLGVVMENRTRLHHRMRLDCHRPQSRYLERRFQRIHFARRPPRTWSNLRY